MKNTIDGTFLLQSKFTLSCYKKGLNYEIYCVIITHRNKITNRRLLHVNCRCKGENCKINRVWEFRLTL